MFGRKLYLEDKIKDNVRWFQWNMSMQSAALLINSHFQWVLAFVNFNIRVY